MMLTTDAHPPRILQLLYIRHTRRLPTATQLPALAPAPDSRVEVDEQRKATMQQAWDSEWISAKNDLVVIEQARSTNRPSPREVVQALDESHSSALWSLPDIVPFKEWVRSTYLPPRRQPDESPERQSLAQVIAAWERGFTTCVILPFAEHFAERLGDHILLMSPGVYESPDDYRRALQAHF